MVGKPQINMPAFIAKRLAYGFLVVALVAVLVSSIIYLAPVDPARLTFGQRSDAATVDLKRQELGLDRPLSTQLLWYLNDLSPISAYRHSPEACAKYNYRALLKFGQWALVIKPPWLRRSFQSGRRVSELLARAIPRTLILSVAAIVLAMVLGIPLGILAALRSGRKTDHLVITLSTLGYSTPSYVSAMLLALLFGFALHDWTGLDVRGGLTRLATSGPDFGKEVIVWRNLLLPALALGIRPVAIIAQLTRSAMLDVLGSDYVRTAHAKGLAARTVILRHVLPNALNPVITAISGWFAALLAGAFFVENVFAFQGLGTLAVNALLNFDLPVVLGSVIVTCIFFVLVNIVADLLYRIVNPQLRT